MTLTRRSKSQTTPALAENSPTLARDFARLFVPIIIRVMTMQRAIFHPLVLASLLVVFPLGGQSSFAQQPTGLDSLNDERLMNELASRGLTNLLDRAFEVNKVPEAERAGRRTILALKDLSDSASSAKLSPTQKQALIAKAVAGVQTALPNLKDPEMMLQGAYVLESQGADDLIKTLEYWGEDTTAMAQLRPIADAALALYARSSEIAAEQSQALANQIQNANSPLVAKVERLEQLSGTSAYRRAMTTYALVLSTDRADPARKAKAIEAINALKEQDVSENQSRVEPRLRVAKLQMFIGQFDDARKLLDPIASADKSLGVEITPPQQYEGKYFRALLELLDKKPAEAQKRLVELTAWQKVNLPPEKPVQDGVAAAAAMMQFRIHDTTADLATSAPAKQDAQGKAVATLNQLLKDQPQLQGIINKLLVARLSDTADMKTLEPLLLTALIKRGEGETLKAEGQTADPKILNRAADAARELISRKGKPGVDPTSVEDSAILLGFLYQRAEKKVEAAAAFVDFCEQFPKSEHTPLAIDSAGGVIGGLYSAQSGDPKVAALYDRFLVLSVKQFKRNELAYTLGRRMQSINKPVDAIASFRLVPESDKRSLDARFFEMVAIKQLLDAGDLKTDERAAYLSQIQSLADRVTGLAASAASAAATPEAKSSAQAKQIRTLLLAAELARLESKDPARAITLLTGFEDKVKGSPGEQDLIAEALQIRVQALIAQDKNQQAGDELVKLQQQSPARGREIVFALLTKLNDDFDKSAADGNLDRMRSLAVTRTKLSDLLLDQVKSSENPEVKKLQYTYTSFNARTKREAAMLAVDEAVRKPLLDQARALYDSLDNPASFQQFLESVPADRRAKFRYDPSVRLGLGLVSFEQGDFDKASRRLGELLIDKVLGSPKRYIQSAGGEEVEIDNDQYWEAVLKLIRSNVQLNQNLDGQKNFLKQQFILAGKNTGGKKWAADFEKLRAEIIPEFVVPEVASAPSAEPATQPAP